MKSLRFRKNKNKSLLLLKLPSKLKRRQRSPRRERSSPPSTKLNTNFCLAIFWSRWWDSECKMKIATLVPFSITWSLRYGQMRNLQFHSSVKHFQDRTCKYWCSNSTRKKLKLATPPVKSRSAPTTDMRRDMVPLSQTSVNRRRKMINIKLLLINHLELLPNQSRPPKMSLAKKIKREPKRPKKLCKQQNLRSNVRRLKLRLWPVILPKLRKIGSGLRSSLPKRRSHGENTLKPWVISSVKL